MHIYFVAKDSLTESQFKIKILSKKIAQ